VKSCGGPHISSFICVIYCYNNSETNLLMLTKLNTGEHTPKISGLCNMHADFYDGTQKLEITSMN
jgi:hypothetical protein